MPIFLYVYPFLTPFILSNLIQLGVIMQDRDWIHLTFLSGIWELNKHYFGLISRNLSSKDLYLSSWSAKDRVNIKICLRWILFVKCSRWNKSWSRIWEAQILRSTLPGGGPRPRSTSLSSQNLQQFRRNLNQMEAPWGLGTWSILLSLRGSEPSQAYGRDST